MVSWMMKQLIYNGPMDDDTTYLLHVYWTDGWWHNLFITCLLDRWMMTQLIYYMFIGPMDDETTYCIFQKQ